MNRLFTILILLNFSISAFCHNGGDSKLTQTIVVNKQKVEIRKTKPKQKRSITIMPSVFLDNTSYTLFIQHPLQGDLGTFTIEDENGLIEYSDSFKADGSINEFSLPTFLSGYYIITLECAGEEFYGKIIL